MPYSKEHKRLVREQIIEAARILFNRNGFDNVTIDQVMNQAGLTRGGFYNHFASKEQLFKEAVAGFLMGRGEQWRQAAGIDVSALDKHAAQKMINSYLSNQHLNDLDGQCPMIALPSDVGRSNSEVRGAYQKLLEGMVHLFEQSFTETDAVEQNRKKALSMSALCVGGMILARTLPDSELANEVQQAARIMAMSIAQSRDFNDY